MEIVKCQKNIVLYSICDKIESKKTDKTLIFLQIYGKKINKIILVSTNRMNIHTMQSINRLLFFVLCYFHYIFLFSIFFVSSSTLNDFIYDRENVRRKIKKKHKNLTIFVLYPNQLGGKVRKNKRKKRKSCSTDANIKHSSMPHNTNPTLQ